MNGLNLLFVFIALFFLNCNSDSKINAKIEEQKVVKDSSLTLVKENVAISKIQIEDNFPNWFNARVLKYHLQDIFDFTKKNELGHLEIDFNGDDKQDIAILINHKITKEEGLLILNNEGTNYYLFGAGKAINGMTDLNWIGIFETIDKGTVIAPPIVDEETGDIIGINKNEAFRLKTNAIHLHVDEGGGGGIVYWKNDKYYWMHQE